MTRIFAINEGRRLRSMFLGCVLAPWTVLAEETEGVKPRRPIEGISDNSFLIEEAYNQEPGVVQHIWTARFGADHRGAANERAWDLGFSQEWPIFGQTHQFAYAVPYAFVDANAEHVSGLGDAELNYRYQLCVEDDWLPAVAPSFTLVLPSGEEDRGLGERGVGYSFNLPLSKVLSDRVQVNLNAGLSYRPNVRLEFSDRGRSDGRDILDFNLGASVVYAVSEDFHLLLEATWDSTQFLEERQRGENLPPYADRRRSEEVLLSPGIRWAWNLDREVQIVPGIAFPIGLTEDAVDYGVFFYFSVEHPFLRQTADK